MAIRTRFNPLGVSKSTYEPGEVMINITGPSFEEQTVTLISGVYEIELIGGGGGSASANAAGAWFYCAGGGGAAGIKGDIYLPAGTYKYFVGSGGAGSYVMSETHAPDGTSSYLIKNDDTIEITAGSGGGAYAMINGGAPNVGTAVGGTGGSLTIYGVTNYTNEIRETSAGAGDGNGSGTVGATNGGTVMGTGYTGNAPGYDEYGFGGQAFSLGAYDGGNGCLILKYLRKTW